MQIKTRTISRREWRRVLRRAYAQIPIDEGGLQGLAGLIRIDQVTAPLTVSLEGRALCLADAGYRWLQLAPLGRHWWLTAQYDESLQLIQYYFDVTSSNAFPPDGEAHFRDWFLDVVMMPDGRLILFDEDELQQALEEGVIDEPSAQLARRTAQSLMEHLPSALEGLDAFCRRLLAELEPRLTPFEG